MSLENFDLFTGEYRDKRLGEVAVPTGTDVLSHVIRGLMASPWSCPNLRWVDKVSPKEAHIFHLYMDTGRMLPTPNAFDAVVPSDISNEAKERQLRRPHKKGGAPGSGTRRNTTGSLAKDVKFGLWPTPKGTPSGPDFARANRDGSGGDDLATAVVREGNMWPTPQAMDSVARSAESFWKIMDRPRQGKMMPKLADMPHMYPTLKAKEVSSNPGQLHPTWVTWLMGFPLRWLHKAHEETSSEL